MGRLLDALRREGAPLALRLGSPLLRARPSTHRLLSTPVRPGPAAYSLTAINLPVSLPLGESETSLWAPAATGATPQALWADFWHGEAADPLWFSQVGRADDTFFAYPPTPRAVLDAGGAPAADTPGVILGDLPAGSLVWLDLTHLYAEQGGAALLDPVPTPNEAWILTPDGGWYRVVNLKAGTRYPFVPIVVRLLSGQDVGVGQDSALLDNGQRITYLLGADEGTGEDGAMRARLKAHAVADLARADEAGRALPSRPRAADTGYGEDWGRRTYSSAGRSDAGAGMDRALRTTNRLSGTDAARAAFEEPVLPLTPLSGGAFAPGDPASWRGLDGGAPPQVQERTATRLSVPSTGRPEVAYVLGTVQGDFVVQAPGLPVAAYDVDGRRLAVVSSLTYVAGTLSWPGGSAQVAPVVLAAWIGYGATGDAPIHRPATQRLLKAREHRVADSGLGRDAGDVTQRAGQDSGVGRESAVRAGRGDHRVSETGLAADSVARRSPVATVRDQGSGVEGRTLRRSKALARADQGSGSEQAVRRARNVQDAGTGAEALSVRRVRLYARSEAATGAEAASVQSGRRDRQDAGTGADVGRVARPVATVRDQGAGTEARTLARVIVRTVQDAGTGAERSVLRTRGVLDAGTGAERAALGRRLARTVQDAGAAQEAAQTTTNARKGADTGTGTEVAGRARIRARSVAEVAYGQETASVLSSHRFEAGQGSEQATRARVRVLTRSDAGLGRDWVGKLARAFEGGEDGLGVDSGRRSVVRIKLVLDAGTGADRLVTGLRGGRDAGTGADVGRRLRARRLGAQDAGSGADTGLVARRRLRIADAGVGADRGARSVVIAVSGSDDGVGRERGRVHPRGGEELGTAAERAALVRRNARRLVDGGAGEDTGVRRVLPAWRLEDGGLGREQAVASARFGRDQGTGTERRLGPPDGRVRAQDAGVGLDRVTRRDRTPRAQEAGVGSERAHVARRGARRTADQGTGHDQGVQGAWILERGAGAERADIAATLYRSVRERGAGADETRVGYPRRAARVADAGRGRDAGQPTTDHPAVADAGRGLDRATGNRQFGRADAGSGAERERARAGELGLDVPGVLVTGRASTARPELLLTQGPAAVGERSAAQTYSWAYWVDGESGVASMTREDGDGESWQDHAPQPVPNVPGFAAHLQMGFDQNGEVLSAYAVGGGRSGVSYVRVLGGVRDARQVRFAGEDPCLLLEHRVVPLGAKTDALVFYLNAARTGVYYRMQVEEYAAEYLYAPLPAAHAGLVNLDQVVYDGLSVLLLLGDMTGTALTLQVGPYPSYHADRAALAFVPAGGSVEVGILVQGGQDAAALEFTALGGRAVTVANPALTFADEGAQLALRAVAAEVQDLIVGVPVGAGSGDGTPAGVGRVLREQVGRLSLAARNGAAETVVKAPQTPGERGVGMGIEQIGGRVTEA